jgi:hypothetical protein
MKRPPLVEAEVGVISIGMMRLISWVLLLVLAFVADSTAHVYSRDGPEDAVTVTGTLVSTDTGEPIAGGHVIVLNPGISPTGYAEDPSNSNAVFAGGESDLNGRFKVAPPVLREQAYSVIVIAPCYPRKSCREQTVRRPG